MSQRLKLDADERKQQIIKAATAVFARKGFAQASMEDIVQESGLSKGGLYWHFKSKDDIIAAVIDQFFSAEFSGIDAILASPIPVAEKLTQLARQSMQDANNQLSQLQNIWLEFYALAGREGAFRDRLLVYMNQYIEVLTGLIQAGVAAGEFRAVEPEQTAIAMTAQFEGLLLLWAIDPGRINLLALTETAVTLLLQGLRPVTLEETS